MDPDLNSSDRPLTRYGADPGLCNHIKIAGLAKFANNDPMRLGTDALVLGEGT
jgi:hypothetical protein